MYLLVIANDTATSELLAETVTDIAGRSWAEVLVVAPALDGRLHHGTPDEDAARAAAAERLDVFVDRLRDAGVHARGAVGDADPMEAIQDALSGFPADEILIATRPQPRPGEVEHDLVDRACVTFGLPVAHLALGAGRPALAA